MRIVRGQDEVHGSSMSDELKTYRKYAKKAAKELGYGTKVQKKIDNAASIPEIERIMVAARHGKIEEANKKHGRL